MVAPLIIACVAVVVAIWQVRQSALAAERSNSLPVASDAFTEFRSQEFQAHLRKVWDEAPSHVPDDGFQSVPEDWRKSALEVAYFFEYLGILVAYELVPEDLVVDFSANLIGRSWWALEPFIKKEREYRRRNGDPRVSPGFVTHFEHLAGLATSFDGGPAEDAARRRSGLRSMLHPEADR